VEYTKSGLDLNRKIFNLNNINQDNVIYADFFSEDFQKKFKEYFDIVLSGGFIEHFEDVHNVIGRHTNILKKGGLLLITIPNLKGLGSFLIKLLDPDNLRLHNMDIMDKKQFENIFKNKGLKKLFCGYFGTFKIFIPNQLEYNFFVNFLIKCFKKSFPLFNIIFRFLFRDKGFERSWLSPYLRFIAIKD
jgi:2-polyprenyl-3-methyl-5-hydroxy-6-metoxy-1,4-benzoquinol methylase